MKWFMRLTLIFAVACSFTTLPIDPSSMQEEINPLAVWSQGNKHFTTSFFPQAKQSGHNFVFSPMSLQVALAMSAELAKELTQKEIIEKVSLPEDASIRRDGAKMMLNQLNIQANANDAFKLSLVNGAWLSSSINFSSTFKTLLNQFYLTELQHADFQLSAEETRKEINAWVEENTSQQIQNLLPQGSIDAKTKLVLVNTLYMHAPWAKPFNPNMTYEAPFYGIEKSLKAIPYMHETATFGYLEEENCVVVELPFKRSNSNQVLLSLFVIVPKEEVILNDLEKQLTTQQLDQWITTTKTAYLDLSLPKFKVSSSIDAKKMLQIMGLQRPFSSEAEFDLGDQSEHLIITDILHKAVFEVDEQGGTGSAGTGVVIKPTSFQESTEVVINRPFLIFVADKKRGLILFAGRVMQPQTE